MVPLVALAWLAWCEIERSPPRSSASVPTFHAPARDPTDLSPASAQRRAELPVLPVRAPEEYALAQRRAEATVPGLLAVHVVDADGCDVADAAVELWRPNSSIEIFQGSRRNRRSVVQTDSSGRCVLAVDSAGDLLVARQGQSGSPILSVAQALATLDVRAEVLLRTRPPVVVEGWVRHADGRPAPRAFVRARWLDSSSGGAGRALETSPPLSEPDGRFSMLVARPGLLHLSAFHGTADTPGVRVTVFEGGAADVVLTFLEPFAIRGHVVDAEGRPCGAAEVAWWHERPGTLRRSTAAEWDDIGMRPSDAGRQAGVGTDGSFDIDVPADGRYVLHARADGHAPSLPVTVELDAEGPRLEAAVTLTLAATATIAGIVMQENGQPLADCAVEAAPASWRCESDGPDVPSAVAIYGRASATTDSQGRFVLEGLSVLGSYRVVCRLQPGWSGGEVIVEPEVPAGTDDLVLDATRARQRGVSVTGHVIDALTRRMVAGAHIMVRANYPDGNRRGVATSDAAGGFVVSGLVPGERYALRADHGDAVGITERFTASVTLPEQVITLPSLSELEVFVRDTAGAPLRGAIVSAAWQEGESSFASIASDANGRAFFKPLNPGTYRISAQREGRTTKELIEVAPGLRRTATLVWPPDPPPPPARR